MADGDTVCSTLPGNLLHHSIAQVTGLSLQGRLAPTGVKSNLSHMERNAEPLAKGLHKFLVPLGLSPSQSIVAMNGCEGQLPT
jgi:hypothetical protein